MTRRDFLRWAGVGSAIAAGPLGNAYAQSGRTGALSLVAGRADALVPVARGRFRGSDWLHRAAGDVTVYRCTDGSCLVRLTAFRVTNGPDLQVVLARHPDPVSARDIRLGYVILGRLQSTHGAQDYFVPAAMDPAAFGSIAIYCRIFDVLFAPAALTRELDRPGLPPGGGKNSMNLS